MDSSSFNVLSLCSGVGGLEIGLRRVVPSARVVCWVEWDVHRIAVLAERMEEKAVDAAPVWTNLYTFDGLPWRGVVDCVVAGYPCQPFSVAGKRSGEEHPEHLWPQCARVIRESEAEWVLLENVPGHLSLGFDTVWQELQEMGYRVEAGLYSAFEAGGTHKRLRLYALGRKPVGNPHTPRLEGWNLTLQQGPDKGITWPPSPKESTRWRDAIERDWRTAPTLSVVRGSAHGIPDRVDRIKALGEAASPLTTALAVTSLMSRNLARHTL